MATVTGAWKTLMGIKPEPPKNDEPFNAETLKAAISDALDDLLGGDSVPVTDNKQLKKLLASMSKSGNLGLPFNPYAQIKKSGYPPQGYPPAKSSNIAKRSSPTISNEHVLAAVLAIVMASPEAVIKAKTDEGEDFKISIDVEDIEKIIKTLKLRIEREFSAKTGSYVFNVRIV